MSSGMPKFHGQRRTRATHLKPGDRVMVQFDSVGVDRPPHLKKETKLFFSKERAPKRAFWATVKEVVRGANGRVSVNEIVVERVVIGPVEKVETHRIPASSLTAVTQAL